MLRMCVYMHSRFIENHPIQILEDGPLIFEGVLSHQIYGGTCCPEVSTPKIQSLADSSTTCHDGINHLHHFDHCLNHNIEHHTVKSHHNGWKTTCLTLRHKPNSISQMMEDLYDTQYCMVNHN
jgi:hypothetical protein